MALEIKVADLERGAEETRKAHTAMSAKLDLLANRLFAATCLICGLVVGSRVISVEQLEKLKTFFGM